MQDLTLVGLSEDRSMLILVSDAGDEYTLPADDKLRAALRGDHARLGQLEIQMDSALRPRDIQARIRAGESPETVAQAAQTTIDRIMTYAGPVLAERAHIADRAQRASVRRKAGEGPARILGDAVAEQLRSKNVDPDSVEWDSWRREDGRWTLVADYRVGERAKRAEFAFDPQGRYVVAEDDESRWLVGEPTARKPQPRAGANGRRLSPVGPEEELPLGDDAIELVTGAAPEDATSDDTVDLTVTTRALRGAGTPGRVDDLGAAGDADWMATQASDRPVDSPSPDRPADTAPAKAETDPAAPETGSTEHQDRLPEAEAVDGPATDPTTDASEADPEEAAPKKSARKGRRASVPSWDEIMFGGGRSD